MLSGSIRSTHVFLKGQMLISKVTPCSPPKHSAGSRASHTHTHTHTHTFESPSRKAGKHAEKEGWPDRRQACNRVKTKNKLRHARRTCSPLQPAARTGEAAARRSHTHTHTHTMSFKMYVFFLFTETKVDYLIIDGTHTHTHTPSGGPRIVRQCPHWFLDGLPRARLLPGTS